MSDYTAKAASGVTSTLGAKTLLGAKREATKWISYGGGLLTLYCDGQAVAYRDFEQNGSHYHWLPWVTI